jgi:hypothetical protein
VLESVPCKTTALVLALIVLGTVVRVPISQGGEKYEANKKEVKKGSRAQQGRVLLDSDSNEQKAKGMTKSDLIEGEAGESKASGRKAVRPSDFFLGAKEEEKKKSSSKKSKEAKTNKPKQTKKLQKKRKVDKNHNVNDPGITLLE